MLLQKLPFFVTLYAILATGFYFFIQGFFPFKASLTGFTELHDLPPLFTVNGQQETGILPEPKFDKLVFMVVDALRSDFVFSEASQMKFTQELIRAGKALPYTAIATAPTVTLPRLKALTTGTVPNFLDAVFNIAESDSSSLSNQDSWLAQLKVSRNKKIHFYGDDTWIRLFPGMFARSEGTSSFFVSDTVEVDVNVTRHVGPELESAEWDTLILHYLGLDHIGHSSGPESPLMALKQQEMDEVVKRIYTGIVDMDAKFSTRTLFVLCGDHGMNEMGNHGGSSAGETSAAMAFMSPQLNFQHDEASAVETEPFQFYRRINQVDLVPTLAMLFGVPIPKNSLGKMIPDLFNDASALELLRLLQINAQQVQKILQSVWPSFRIYDALPGVCDGDVQSRLECLYSRATIQHRSSTTLPDQQRALDAYYEFLNVATSSLSSIFSNYDLFSMCAGLGFMAIPIILVVGIQIWGIKFPQISLFKVHFMKLHTESGWPVEKAFLLAMVVAYAATMFASSFVEEEHQFWYFMLNSIWLLQMLKSLFALATSGSTTANMKMLPVLSLCQMALIRVIRFWNQTGQKYAANIDLRYHLTRDYEGVSWALFGATLLTFNILAIREFVLTRYSRTKDPQAGFINSCVRVCILISISVISLTVGLYKLRVNESSEICSTILKEISPFLPDMGPNSLARIAYFLVLLITLVSCVLYRLRPVSLLLNSTRVFYPRMIQITWSLLLILLSRSHNAPLYLLFYLQLSLYRCWRAKYSRNVGLENFWMDGLVLLALGRMAFFALGNSNSLASVDLSNSYVGLESYNMVLVGLLTFLSTCAGPLWWCMAGIFVALDGVRYRMDIGKSQETNRSIKHSSVLVILFSHCAFQLVSSFALSLAVTILRTHLFIWTVFSPRYLYEVMWLAFQFVSATVMLSILD
ncbi:alkaline phosphatase-like protein [Basidiobolus meristosporus CBS 931.73]|uniref:GPI ethanolamine phosphate transferase 2 n=1 Tax=Basidiobolus meristosporus CBS 931.73 TaxID=1314790 RepID=A0A1Y1Y3H9_9FUNG|nr:alkaline phosphatase-like protein [Basidiobolus meristosporus CBS 931.73]|eukprot:ORX92581.1 alkaline phosphatase-like protein [Basidiobolus meristosporus CBS 931.73]